MSARGWTMKFVPAIVYHTHPDTLGRYLNKKYKFAFLLVCAAFLVNTLPFAWRALLKDPVGGLLSPVLLAARAVHSCWASRPA